ncbi:hypothetical protein [Halosegnis marinus]|uniref:DUF1059 domain-containing protein n=1 Tax=Halosegnis marinus TaxID=3034023 RepID=A0ABD5ZPJ5_9EURY|nr:hypothetical protein [Halosegnis sp. DT85]
MACRITCDGCSLDRRFEDCVEAHERASAHELSHGDHFVSLRTLA